MSTEECQWKSLSDLCSEGRVSCSLTPFCAKGQGFHLSEQGCRAAVSPHSSERLGWEEEAAWPGGHFQASQGSLCVFVAGVKLTSLALKFGSTPCSETVFAMCYSLAPSLEKFTWRISY